MADRHDRTAVGMRSAPGSYAILLACSSVHRLRIGRLGWLVTEPGCYVYVGSALGPGGVAARVGRHLRQSVRRHWHVDYLRPATCLTECWLAYDPSRREHEWADAFAGMPGSSVPLVGFGCSDCGCESHLFHFASPPRLASFRRKAAGVRSVRFTDSPS